MTPKEKFTTSIRVKGWYISEFLIHIGRSYDWYHRNISKGGEKEHLRLELMIKGIEEK